MSEGRTGVETASRAAAVRATRLLETGPEEAFDRLCVLGKSLLDVPMTYMTVVDEVRSFLKGAPDSAALCGPDGTFEAPAREAACQLVVDSGVEVVAPDTAADPRLRDLIQIKAFGARAWLGVPVLDPDGYVLGNLCAMDVQVRDWTAAEVAAIRTLAAAANDTIGLRLAAQDLAHYAEESAELAEILQQSLLPAHAPRVPGMEIATRFIPGGTGVDVLGDFYDVVPLVGGGFGVVIGDVCGKGAAAARTTALARSAVRTAALSEPDPGAVLDTVNEVLLSWFGAGRSFVTAVYATFARTGAGWSVRIAGAGHPPGFVRRDDGTVEQRPGGGRVLGLTADHPTAIDTVELAPGDALVLYTDGITEARDPAGAQFEEDGVARSLAAQDGADAEALAGTLVTAAARHHARATNDDDAAVVVLRVEP
ncbi:SpoIIE family protein phosphatase [Actinomycetospora endophytica]|uniref:SpoIIE family protein phosphatase n=1 Tax=Actinomycetospora endophytica TaxID=2291215 RepID=A0ABS8PH21_9PSEU|nr:SpoIIE family protein phosphatase [Actinomycetospora endophytica]MCD2197556.1 SpoIIE family protein phosphatase [Actinomycetospora endophytica]